MRRMSKMIGPAVLVAAAMASAVTTGCLKLTDPKSKGLSIVAEPDTTPVVIAPFSITMVAGASASPAGLAWVFTVHNTADTVAYVATPPCGAITLRAGPDQTSAAVNISYPVCAIAATIQPLQPGQSISYTKDLPNGYISGGTAQGDYYAWAQLPVPRGSAFVLAPAGRVHWGG